MFKSIKWKFVLVYFSLVFISMVIVGIFIVGRLENQQIDSIEKTMIKHIETILNSSSYLMEDNWDNVKYNIQDTLNEWRLDSTEKLYIISNEDAPIIISSSIKEYDKIINQNALSFKNIDPTLVIEAYEGEKASRVVREENENRIENHVAYPVMNNVGRVKGILYMVSDLENVLTTVDESKVILTNATLIAIIITISLGFLIASSITEPIRDVTKKAEEMAGGNFNQFVEVKSEDEIGQLANMFNYLTLKLKNTIEEMDLERSKLDTIFKYMGEGVLAIDISGNIIHANPISIDILDLKEGPNHFPKEILDFDNVDFQSLDNLNGDKIVNIKDEIYKVKYAPFKNEMKIIGGLILVFQNITDEHKLDNMRKEFVANVSHELKTPITTIKSYTETLMDVEVDRSTETRFLQIIDDECDRMGRLVRDLLQLSNLDYKKVNWKKEMLSINDLIENIIVKQKLSLEEKRQNLDLDLGKIDNVFVDKDSIEQVLSNVISNAIKYTQEDGRVKIKTYPYVDSINIEVEDNGYGIPKEDLDRIFERFYRVEKGRSRDLGGTGLGLSIAKEIIEAHGGKIEIESVFEQGTKVSINLPLDVM